MRKWMIGCSIVPLAGIAVLFGIVAFAAVFVNGRTGAETDFSKSALLQAPPPPLDAPAELKIITYNVQNLWVVGRNRPARMRAIGEYLTQLDPDIVGFQEVFVAKDRRVLIDALQGSRLRYHEYFPSGTVGSGLLIMSAWPIREAFFHRYTASNEWFRLWEGDWWGGKGVALARIDHPAGIIDFYNTHAQAGYGRAANKVVRMHQMREAALFVNSTRTGTAPAFLVGDFNCRPGDPEFEHLVSEIGMAHLMDGGTRIDNIFGMVAPAYTFEVTGFTEWSRHNGLRLSDHRGYMSTIRVAPQGEPA
ncbi:MAG TPA: endonuclease/exonuclease/phosphatase family protein [Candidatus Hydrogenedentes bacterium]|nr:endonuclease/exonuclease/phosphatase family protein [Candidatus Hydrogenedentota bacterium]HNT88037.1 endonuclease/exonuclease/phosphatase family protein [Candidatus Hydrogenedentota bacterium]